MSDEQQEETPLKIATGKADDFSAFRAFGCHACVPGGSEAKFHSRSRKGVFLGFPKNTTKNTRLLCVSAGWGHGGYLRVHPATFAVSIGGYLLGCFRWFSFGQLVYVGKSVEENLWKQT